MCSEYSNNVGRDTRAGATGIVVAGPMLRLIIDIHSILAAHE